MAIQKGDAGGGGTARPVVSSLSKLEARHCIDVRLPPTWFIKS